MPVTYEPIATTTLSSAASTITFSSIPSTYTDLRLVFNFAWTAAALDGVLRINNNSSQIYSQTVLRGDGSSVSSDRETTAANRLGLRIMQGTWGNTGQMFFTADIMNYSNSTTNKTILMTTNGDYNGSGQVLRHVGLVQTTNSIDRIDLVKTFGTGNFAAGSTATLYGIKAA